MLSLYYEADPKLYCTPDDFYYSYICYIASWCDPDQREFSKGGFTFQIGTYSRKGWLLYIKLPPQVSYVKYAISCLVWFVNIKNQEVVTPGLAKDFFGNEQWNLWNHYQLLYLIYLILYQHSITINTLQSSKISSKFCSIFAPKINCFVVNIYELFYFFNNTI